MPTATLVPAPVAGSDAEDRVIFDLDLRITESGSVVQEAAAATQGDNCVMTDNCHCQR